MRRSRGGGRLKTEAHFLRQPAHQCSDPATDELLLGLTLRGVTPARCVTNGVWREIRARTRGHIGISPFDTSVEFDVSEPHELLVVALDKTAIQWVSEYYVDDCLDLLSTGVLRYRRDAKIESSMLEIWKALGERDAAQGLLVDGLTEMLLARVLANLGARTKLRSPRRALPLVEIDALIRSQLDVGVSIAELSKLCGVPRSSFNRTFRDATGSSPYQYVQRIRHEVACELLGQRHMGLADVADALGFSDQAHFTRFFKRVSGFTPGVYRGLPPLDREDAD